LSPCELIRRKSVGDVKKGKDVRGRQDNRRKESWKNSVAERFVCKDVQALSELKLHKPMYFIVQEQM
jgi:hypothetical protein